MFGGGDSGLSDLFERLPGRPWWWGVGLGLALVALFFGLFHGIGGAARRLPRPGDNFSDDNPLPVKTPVAQKKKPSPPPVKTASPAETANLAAGTAEQPGTVAAKDPQPASSVTASAEPVSSVAASSEPASSVAASTRPVPAELSQWEDSDFVRAWQLHDSRLTTAVEQRAKNAERSAAEAEMLEMLLRPSPLAKPASADRPRVCRGESPSPVMLRAVAVAFGANNTAAARQTLARLLAGEFSGVDGSSVAEDTVAVLLRQGSPESRADRAPPPGRPAGNRYPRGESSVRGGPARRGHGPDSRLRIGATAEAAGRGRDRRDGPGRRAAGPGVAAVRGEPAEYRGAGAALSKRSGGHGDARGVGEAICGGQHGGDANAAGAGDEESRGRAAHARTVLPGRRTALGTAVDELPCRTVPGAEGAGRRSGRGGPGGHDPQRCHAGQLPQDPQAALDRGTANSARRGVPGAILVEPGLVAVLKSLIRESQRLRAESAKAAGARLSITHGHGNGHATGSRLRTSKAPKATPDSAWEKLTGELITDYCERCHLAALARTARQASDAPTGDPSAGDPSARVSVIQLALSQVPFNLFGGIFPLLVGNGRPVQ